MYIQQLYTNCLAEAAYYIESNGEAAIIDPIRETEPYIQLAANRGSKITHVFETHFHADFVSGHLDLAAKTGAIIVFGPGATTGYKSYQAKDGEMFQIGKIMIKVLHTPGHTLESSCYLLLDENGKESCLFSGDTLFVGDVGRPDLLDSAVKLTSRDMAGMLYDSLHHKIMPLSDEVIVYPAHGPGSACGKNIGKETWSTIGEQKKNNYALQALSKEEFILKVTAELSAPPHYFFDDAKINKDGYQSLESVIANNRNPLSVKAFEEQMTQGAMVLDTRSPDEFEKCFVKGAINIGLDGTFAVWVGTLLNIDQALVLVTDPGKEEETLLRLARVGYEKVSGYLEGGIESWKKAGKEMDRVDSVSPETFASMVKGKDGSIIDVRRPEEIKSGKVKGSINISLQDLLKNLNQIDKNTSCFVHCAGGYRSMIASSILKAHGFKNLKNVLGGFNKIKSTGIEMD